MDSDIIPVRKGEEIEIQSLEIFLRKHIDHLPDESLTIKQFNAGKSNLTYQLEVGEWQAVLRRPPLGPVAPKAHDMEREFKILQEIYPYFSPAPKPYLYADKCVIGSPFFIMERKQGIVLDNNFPKDIKVTQELCRRISEKMVDTLVDLHAVDYKKTKLEEMTRPSGFMERQVHGWIKRYFRSETHEIKGLERLTNWLMNHIPTSQDPTIIHYDFKLNNTMFDYELNKVIGLFDWEMTTVGEPLADLGVAMSYWTNEMDSEQTIKKMDEAAPLTSNLGFMSRNEFMESYAKKSGRDVSNMHFYLTFAYFKLAVICQQIYFRWKKGQTHDKRFVNLDLYVRSLIQYAILMTNKRI